MLTAKKLLQKYSSKNNFTYYWMNPNFDPLFDPIKVAHSA